MNSFDLTLLSLYRINGQEWPQLPGLLALDPPKRAARGREQDRLITYLTLVGNLQHSSSDYNQIVAQAAETFYNTPGSLTFALKSAVERLNTFLTERNLATTGRGQYSIGALVMAALRGDSLYIVQCGPTHAFIMGRELQHYHDSQLSGKGLGLGQTTRMYFSQAKIYAGDRILFCAALPPNWEKAISEERHPASIEATRRRLLAVNDGNVSAVLIQISEGTGTITLLKPLIAPPASTSASASAASVPVSAPAPTSASASAASAPVSAPASTSASAAAASVPVSAPAPTSASASAASAPVSAPAPTSASLSAASVPVSAPAPTSASASAASVPVSAPAPTSASLSASREQIRATIRKTARFLAIAIGRGRQMGQSFQERWQTFVPRLLPAGEDGQSSLLFGCSWPLFLAILLPVLVLVVGVSIYTYIGVPRQVQGYYRTAEEFRQKARVAVEPQLQREYWKTVLEMLATAEEYTPLNAAARQLRSEAQTELDALNRVTRIELQPAFSMSLSPGLQVTRLAASDTDIYLLDSGGGAVRRGVFNGKTFDLDGAFRCGPGEYNGIRVGALLDIISLPRGNPLGATVLGVDASGNLLYCIPGANPRASYLQMPETGWKRITAVAYDANNLYVLDAPASAVWVYFGTADGQFPGKPYYFFENQIPQAMPLAVGLAVNGDDLYILFRDPQTQDGYLTTCTLSRLVTAPTRCNDPALFVDTRPGYQGGIRLADGKFSQIAFSGPPDPAVLLLQPFTQEVFKFSPRSLELQKILRDQPYTPTQLPEGDEGMVTAMAFSPNKSLFLFVGGDLYVAFNVP
ncbi:MAG: hypothetical protein N2117_05485 [Anaerolineales bacterium]|nr:hypothetical protein [Anaerolineales bacterium]